MNELKMDNPAVIVPFVVAIVLTFPLHVIILGKACGFEFKLDNTMFTNHTTYDFIIMDTLSVISLTLYNIYRIMTYDCNPLYILIPNRYMFEKYALKS